MSISKVFYTLIDDKSAIFEKAEFHNGHVIFHARLRHTAKRCSYCKSTKVQLRESKEMGVNVVKGQRFLLLRNFVDLDDSQKSSLQRLLEISAPLAIAHTMKEQFRAFWNCRSRREGASGAL